MVLSTRRASLWRFFVPLQPRRYEVQAPYSVLMRASPWPRRDQGAGRDQEHRYPWPPGRAKGAAASAHAATGGASAAGAGWAAAWRRFWRPERSQQAQAFGPEQRLGPPGGEATHSPGPEPRSQALKPEPGCAWPSVQRSRGGCRQSITQRFRMPPGCPWMQARSGGASVQRGRSPRWQPASRCRSVRARPRWAWGRMDDG